MSARITEAMVDAALAASRDKRINTLTNSDAMRFILEAALSTEPGEAEGMVLVPKAALNWLNGEGPDDNGYWFGDGHEALNPVGAFWWRKVFNRMLPAAPLPEDTREDKP